ncbi:MAG TPA: aldehyde dehydrogenase family protein [Solirubrobacterales bacterium]|nr:aldehyde dehydrogenase family protein [Solirubrobacterales bacterium]
MESVASAGARPTAETTGIAVENPATGEALATVPDLRRTEVETIAAAARAAQPGWWEAGFEERARVLMAARAWLVGNGDRVVETICAETGKPADETLLVELGYGVSALEFWAKRAPDMLADEIVETASPSVRGGRELKVRYEPVGVVAVIGPWNFPLVNSFGDCIPALAAGNAVVLKPSEVTPLTSLLMAEMLATAGLPEGVFTVATGGGETGAALVDLADYVMFTGSLATGRKVMAQAAETLTPVSLELGGKDPMIVLADADLERAVNAALTYGLGNSGQVCISVERIYVEDAVHDEFVDRLTAKAESLRQGPPAELGAVDLGAIIFPPQLELIEAHVRDAIERGAEVRTGGRAGDGPGRFFEPTVLTGVDHSMLCMTEETFGPTLPVMRVRDAEEAVALANEGDYGLQASVWTGDVERGEALARRIEAGVSCVNDAQVNYSALELPMGGWKRSGMGSRHGVDGIRKYTRRQSILVTPAYAPAREVHMFPYVGEVTAQVADALSAYAASELFDDGQRSTLSTLCDTWVPSLDPPDGADPTGFWARSASDLSVPVAVELALIESGAPTEQLTALGGLLDALAGEGMAAAAPQEVREAILAAFMADPEAAAGLDVLRGACLSLHYALPDAGTGINPNWPGIGYPGPQALPKPVADVERPIEPIEPSGDLTLSADVVIVGSGAGGGVIAGELAAAGKQVCVLEMGGYHDESEFNGLELWAYQHIFLNGGPFATAEGQVSIQAGSALGGGTVLNWTNCLRTTDHVRAEWAAHGLEGIDGPDYEADMNAVWKRLGVTGECSDLNGPHRLLQKGCEARGLDFRAVTRNTDPASYDPVTAGYLGFGDQSGSKRSTAKTYLADAAAAGADFLIHSRVERVLVEDGRAAGVEATYLDPDGRTARVTVRAPAVVVACGSIESPALLLRSGIGGPAVGDHLRLHPTSVVFGYHEERQDPWWGPPQAGLSHEYAELDDGYGFLIECAQHTTGLTAAALPWRSGRDHKLAMTKYPYSGGFINLTRDRGHGRVTIDGEGRPVMHYPVRDELDIAHIHRGLAEMARIMEAAGAEEMQALSRHAPIWKRGDDLEGFIAAVGGLSISERQIGLFSAHQMGSCRMGADPETSVAGPWGELHDAGGVWIGDASAFPTASGTNPMFTTMALARRTARAILASA